MSRAEEVLNNYKPTTPNIDTQSYVNQNNQAMNNYTSRQQEILNAYKQQGSGYLQNLKQQTQLQVQNLNNQLKTNMAKYDNQAKYQQGVIQDQYNTQRDSIDAQTFENYKMANQQGALRGVSQSAQQRAMDNHVGQQSSALFYQNDKDKNTSLNELNYKILEGKMGLQQEYMSDLTKLNIAQMQQEGEYGMQMAQQELQFASSMADKIIAQQLQNNEIQFNTEKEMEMYKAQLAQELFNKQFQNAQTQDGYDEDWKKLQANFAHDKDMQNLSFAQQKELAQLQASLSAKYAGSSGGSGEDGSNAEYQEMYNAWKANNDLYMNLTPAQRKEYGLEYIPYNQIEQWYTKSYVAPYENKIKKQETAKTNATNYLSQTSPTQSLGNIASVFGGGTTSSTSSKTSTAQTPSSTTSNTMSTVADALKRRYETLTSSGSNPVQTPTSLKAIQNLLTKK